MVVIHILYIYFYTISYREPIIIPLYKHITKRGNALTHRHHGGWSQCTRPDQQVSSANSNIDLTTEMIIIICFVASSLSLVSP